MTFEGTFETLTGYKPFPWQEELFKRFSQGEIPPSCNLPTGLGKTNVMAIWLIALACGQGKLPRRLVYVVNRRTVVDQATREAEKLRKNLQKPELADLASRLRRLCAFGEDNAKTLPLAISTLRGQFADNGEWSADPARPAIIVGTVDMIGSRLLFSGYRIGYRRKPLHAGFLGQDTLLVHDEAHLEPAFQKLLLAICEEQKRCNEFGTFHVLEMSATAREKDATFGLTVEEQNPPNEVPDPPMEPIHRVWRRLTAKKTIHLHPLDDRKKLADTIAGLAFEHHKDSGRAVLVFAQTVDGVEKVADKLRKVKQQVETLTGTMRGLERDGLLKKPVFQRFLTDSNRSKEVTPANGTVYLICTSAGEVGIDISADHMVCDLSAFDSMAQRFGRINRFGDRDDTCIDVVYPKAFDEKGKLTPARQATLSLLEQLKGDASPKALAKLDAEQRKAAFAPEPTVLPATDILFDAWALTTIRDKMPGRPQVEPYLHGLAEWEPPRTNVAWREEVEHITNELVERCGDDFPQTLLEDYPLKTHELLSDTSNRVFKALEVIAKRYENSCPLWIIGERGEVEVSSLERLLGRQKKQVIGRISDCTILLPPTAGGLSEGMLDGTSDHADDVADMLGDPSERRIRKLCVEPNGLDEATGIEGMRLVRSIELDTDEEDEAAKRVWEWYKLKPLEDTRTAQKPVELYTHIGDVEDRAQRIAKGLSLPDEIAEAVVLAAKLHDNGKQWERFQTTLGNRHYPDMVLAKSGRKGARLPEPFRHEFASLMNVADDVQVRKLSPPMQDLVLHLIAAHHGRARPYFPADEVFDPTQSATDAETLAIEIPRRFARLQCKYGRWGLAYLESLLRAADWAASAEPSQFVIETKEVSP